MMRQDTNWLENLADVKRVGFGDKAEFDVNLDGIRAFVQAKGATTPRTRDGYKKLTLETLSVSARPFVNIVELQNGLTDAAKLINKATYQMEVAMNKHIESVLANACTTWGTPYYDSGSGVVKATIDPMILFWLRLGGAAIFGDIAELNKFGPLTGFTASPTAQQFSGNIIDQQNQNAFIGTYMGAQLVKMLNPLQMNGTDDFVFNTKKLYIVPTAIDEGMRPLKVVFEGDVFSMEQNNINDLSWEIRLDQYFNAAIAKGDRPYLGVYQDLSN